MLPIVVVTALFGTDEMFELFPADRSQVPVLKQRSFTVAEWQKVDEEFAKGEWKYERLLRSVELQQKRSRESIRAQNAISRSKGITVEPDPEEPTESVFFPKKKN